jgi:hypothetical protein
MNFSFLYVRETLGIGEHQLRNWKRQLPPIAGRDGRRTPFNESDLAALAIVHTLAGTMGISMVWISEWAEDIWAICRERSWKSLQERSLLLAPGASPTLCSRSVAVDVAWAVVVTLGPVLRPLEELTLSGLNGDQLDLL